MPPPQLLKTKTKPEPAPATELFFQYYNQLSSTAGDELSKLFQLLKNKEAWNQKAAILRDRLLSRHNLTPDEWAELGSLGGFSTPPEEARKPMREIAAPNDAGPAPAAPPAGRPQRAVVKKERLSACAEDDRENAALREVRVKLEQLEAMPAPGGPAPKAKRGRKPKIKAEPVDPPRRVTRSKAARSNDVVVLEPVVPVVTLSDSDEEPARHPKRGREEEACEARAQKRSREEAALAGARPLDGTFVAEAARAREPAGEGAHSSLMTDDESEEEEEPARNVNTKTVAKAKRAVAEVQPSPVKQKVKQFEALSMQTRVTRTKTRALAEEEEVDEQPPVLPAPTKTNVKEKVSLYTTPTATRLPKSTSSQKKGSESGLKALKSSQAEYKERERVRREKEQEAERKREALIQARCEENRRVREAKHLQAQRQRELLGAEKQRALEAHRAKEARKARLLAEQEEAARRAKEEAERRRAQAKLAAAEARRAEAERARLEDEQQLAELRAAFAKQDAEGARPAARRDPPVPAYMRSRTPRLPTYDCLDSDEEDYEADLAAAKVPAWARSRAVKVQSHVLYLLGEEVKNTFFSIQAQTPDLQDIFEVIAPSKLARKSSAIWHKPPRFTMMPRELLEQAAEDSD